MLQLHVAAAPGGPSLTPKTENVCCPLPRPLYVTGEAQGVEIGLSSAQKKCTSFWSAVNMNSADVTLVGPPGPAVIVVTGGVSASLLEPPEPPARAGTRDAVSATERTESASAGFMIRRGRSGCRRGRTRPRSRGRSRGWSGDGARAGSRPHEAELLSERKRCWCRAARA